jgi:uncharacterized membrane protein
MQMNRTRLIWGIICLVIAAGLAVINLSLPPESLVFHIGEANMPWVPVAALAIVGAVLLGTAGIGKPVEAPTATAQSTAVQDGEKAVLNKRLETAAWGLFLIMLGGFALVPNSIAPKGAWALGVGLIMLGLNATRYFLKIRMSGFTTVLGILSLVGGISDLVGWTSLEGAWLLIILGAYLVVKPWFDKRQLFGKAEES